MASGGARGRSGPVPDRNALRHGRAGADWIRLPASGRAGAPPEWPRFAVPRPTKAELAHWTEEWKRPQALMWEGNNQELEVASYVRAFRIAADPKAKAGDRNLVKQLAEYLGISQPGLARLHWTIVEDSSIATEPAAGADGDGKPIAFTDARDRLRRIGNAG